MIHTFCHSFLRHEKKKRTKTREIAWLSVWPSPVDTHTHKHTKKKFDLIWSKSTERTFLSFVIFRMRRSSANANRYKFIEVNIWTNESCDQITFFLVFFSSFVDWSKRWNDFESFCRLGTCWVNRSHFISSSIADRQKRYRYCAQIT